MERLSPAALADIDAIVAAHKGEPGPTIVMLHDVQNKLGYIPFEAMEKILFSSYGFGRTRACTSMPYMIPDNSTELNAYFGGYFLNNDSLMANKAVNRLNIARVISLKEYLSVKKQIEDKLK